MQQGRASTIRFNEWICVCAQHEKAVARIGRQVYQAYSRGMLHDLQAIELCKEISQAFADSKRVRADMEEELERDALRGLSVEEAKAAEEILELTQTEKMLRSAKLSITKLLGRGRVNHSLQSYRDRVRDLSRDLGMRALVVYENEPLLKMESHLKLCSLAVKLEQDSDKKWEEITKAKAENGGLNLSFHTILVSFITSFASFSRNSPIGKALLKLMKYDAKEEEKKLTKQFEGSKTAEALQAQMAEVEEPVVNIERELENLERVYEETPTDWGLPPRAAEDSWIPDTADTWSPTAVEETVTPPKASLGPMPPKPGAIDGPKPQLLRQRKQPDSFSGAEAWAMGTEPAAPEPDSWAAPSPPAPISPAPPMRREPTSTPTIAEAPVDDWATEFDSTEPSVIGAPRRGSAPPPPATPPAPRLRGTPTALPLDSSGPLSPRPEPPLSPTPSPLSDDSWGSVEPAPPRRPAPPTPAAPGQRVPDLPPLPPLPSRPIRSLEFPELDAPPAAPAPPSPPPEPSGDDPLLRLLRTDSPAAKASSSDDDDDLLPAFLRERNDDEGSDLGTSFIPDLPESVDSGLKILPFGSQQKRSDDDDFDSFIPQMPD